MSNEDLKKIKEKAERIYKKKNTIFCPYFNSNIILNADGFHHLQFSARRERNTAEKILKFKLLPCALKIIGKSGTLQEFRQTLQPIGKTGKDGFAKTKNVSYWAFIAIIGETKQAKVKTILRQVGDGNIIFWSVMPYSRLKNGQKLYSGDIEDE